MGKTSSIHVLESIVDLKRLHGKHKEERSRKRLRMLCFVKERTFKTRLELAKELQIGKRTLERWLHTYETKGIEPLLSPITRTRSSDYISEQAHEQLEKKMQDPHDAFTSYVEIQQWLRQKHNSDIKYNNLYYYMRKHFKASLR